MHVQFEAAVPLSTINLCPPNPSCGICRDTYTKVLCDPGRVTFGKLVEGILGDGVGEDGGTEQRDVSVYEDKRVLSDPNWDDNNERIPTNLGVTQGKFVAFIDEEGAWGTVGGVGCDLPWVILSLGWGC